MRICCSATESTSTISALDISMSLGGVGFLTLYIDSNGTADKEIFYIYQESESINFILLDEGDNASDMVGCKSSARNRFLNCQYHGLWQKRLHWQIHWRCHWQICWHWHGL